MTQINIEQYRDNFSGDRGTEALKYAHDIRKFEIELYWRRATYFWTFIGAAFAGYFAIQKETDVSNIFIVTSLGFIFSLGWYFVNRGSGAWQRNWEAHVDFLEDRITGPLHKTLIDRGSYKIWKAAEPFSFSPSRINNILALYMACIWLFLMFRTAWKAKQYLPIQLDNINPPQFSMTILGVSILTVTGVVFLFWGGRSRRREESNNPIQTTEIFLRSYELPTHPPSARQ